MEENEKTNEPMEDTQHRIKELKRKIIKTSVGSIFGICSGVLVKKCLNAYLPFDPNTMNKVAYTLGTYGLYSASVLGVSKAVGKDVNDWLDVIDNVKGTVQLYRALKKNYEEYKEQANGDDADSGQ